VPSVAKVKAALVSTLVGAVLQGDDSVAGPQLFLSELASVLIGFLRADRGLSVLGCLFKRNNLIEISSLKILNFEMKYLATESLKADDDRVEILLFPQVDSLEELLGRNAHIPGSLQEGVDVLHALESHLGLLNFLHTPWLHNIHKPVIIINLVFNFLLGFRVLKYYLQRRVPSRRCW